MRILFISLALFVFAVSCKRKHRTAVEEIIANSPPPTNMNAGHEKYTLDVPKGWTSKHQTNYGVDYFFLMAPKTVDDPNTNINVISEFMQNQSLEEYLKGAIKSLKKAIPSAEILEEGTIVANGVDGVWYSYTMKPEGINVTIVTYIFPKNGVAYGITGGTQTNLATKYRPTFDKVAKSFRFLE